MKKILFLILILTGLCLKYIPLEASTHRFVNEINNVSLNQDAKTLDISGWAFIQDTQHFKDSSTHSYTLTLKSSSDTIISEGRLTNISHTDTMFYLGSRYCGTQEYNVPSQVCNNYYENIGFTFSVPLRKFKMDQTYIATLTIKAKQSNVSMTKEVYFPNKNTLTLEDGRHHYILDSKLHNMSFKVLDDFVYVRDKAGKGGNILQSKTGCSTNNNLYYAPNTVFTKVLDKDFLNNTTYYKVSGQEDVCLNGRRRVKQGNDLSSMWIASTFIEHMGEALSIKTKENNQGPTITIDDHPTLYVNEPLDIWKGVSAKSFDNEDLTSQIKIEENTYQNKVGFYHIKFSVTDKYGDTSYATKFVTVIQRNHPPVIVAEDIEITQYAPYDPYDHAEAYDQDNENISKDIQSTTTIDTSKLEPQKQCYIVKDKYNLESSKCITVTIIKAKSSLRFIQQKHLFYSERVPRMWEYKEDKLNLELKNDIIYDTVSISK